MSRWVEERRHLCSVFASGCLLLTHIQLKYPLHHRLLSVTVDLLKVSGLEDSSNHPSCRRCTGGISLEIDKHSRSSNLFRHIPPARASPPQGFDSNTGQLEVHSTAVKVSLGRIERYHSATNATGSARAVDAPRPVIHATMVSDPASSIPDDAYRVIIKPPKIAQSGAAFKPGNKILPEILL